MFGFLMCNILQARLCVCWKSSDPFVCLGADCNKCTAVFSTRQIFYLVAAWTQASRGKSACMWHVVSPILTLNYFNIQLLLYRLLAFKVSLEVIISIFLPLKEESRLQFDSFSANLYRFGL